MTNNAGIKSTETKVMLKEPINHYFLIGLMSLTYLSNETKKVIHLIVILYDLLVIDTFFFQNLIHKKIKNEYSSLKSN